MKAYLQALNLRNHVNIDDRYFQIIVDNRWDDLQYLGPSDEQITTSIERIHLIETTQYTNTYLPCR